MPGLALPWLACSWATALARLPGLCRTVSPMAATWSEPGKSKPWEGPHQRLPVWRRVEQESEKHDGKFNSAQGDAGGAREILDLLLKQKQIEDAECMTLLRHWRGSNSLWFVGFRGDIQLP